MDINGTDQNDKLGGAKNGSSFREIERINLITGIGSDKINLSAANYGWHWGTNVAAGEGNDSLVGGEGAFNLLSGEKRNDTIVGGNNTYDADRADELYGGEGYKKI